MTNKANARVALLVLTALNFINYVDRSILFAVQEMVKAEFALSDKEVGALTSAFFAFYMVAAPIIALLADNPQELISIAVRFASYIKLLSPSRAAVAIQFASRVRPFSRKWIMAGGAFVWSLATLLTAITKNYDELFLRHVIVGIGEASFVAMSPAFLSDLFPETKRGRMLSIFYIAIPAGTALGYLIGGYLGHEHGWRMPFLVCAIPGLLLCFALLALKEPERGANDHIADSLERGTILGLFRNKGYLTVTLGLSMLTFAMGGLQVWMPTFLTRMRGVPLNKANLIFGGMTLVSGGLATLLGGWLGDRLLKRTPAGYHIVSAAGMVLSIPAMVAAIYVVGPEMYPAIFLGEFLLLLNTGPLNAALMNSVSAKIRATAVAVNLFAIHALGDVPSPVIIGWVSDRTNLQTGFFSTVIAVALSAGILLYGMRFAPKLPASVRGEAVAEGRSV
jgi:MFS transporter, Spinster family, sphingosine-1-phosphate transporter